MSLWVAQTRAEVADQIATELAPAFPRKLTRRDAGFHVIPPAP
jgi:hypothetical protein